jgi:hypothetical protein
MKYHNMTKEFVERPIIDQSKSTHYSTHWKWHTPKGRKEMLAKRNK